MTTNIENISTVILAGGQGSRLGGQDKGLLKLRNIPLIQHLVNRIQAQTPEIIISANRNLDRYEKLGFPVYEDDIKGSAGPLAGILTALNHCNSEWLLTVPADMPFIPVDIAEKLKNNINGNKIVIAHDGQHLQPTIALIHKSLANDLKKFLLQGEHKARAWMQQHPHTIVDFSKQPDAFININTEDELTNAEKHFETFMA